MVERLNAVSNMIWGMPLLVIMLGVGIVFTIAMKGMQFRMIPTMVKLLVSGKKSEQGLSSFQAFALAIAGRVGVGNIAGVATAVWMGGPGAIFWMWIIAFVGAATSFAECALAQLHKRLINNEYRGGWMFYIGDKWKGLGVFTAVLFAITMPFTQSSLHSNNIASAVNDAFGIPKLACGIGVAVILAAIVFGGAKRIGRAAELVVPFMATGYIIVALVIVFANISAVPEAFALIIQGAFGKDAVIGAALGSTMTWGARRAIFSSEAGLTTATPSAASAEVAHPAEQGLVQAFSVYICVLFICTATGLMMVITGCYNVQDAAGNILYSGLDQTLEAGPAWVSAAVNTVIPWGSQFIAIAIFFFGFTSIMNHNYSTISSVMYFFQGKRFPKWLEYVIDLCFIGGVVFGSTMSLSASWAVGDIFLGTCTWINYLFLFLSAGASVKLLQDYESQKKAGHLPIFDPDRFEGQKWFDFDMSLWRTIRDRYRAEEAAEAGDVQKAEA